ncbi:kelch-like protein 2 [Montipora foliosa]|uniref:kelch-like protein 2 n=1 Tax=Montipora foliosa TaxID=591990 RepID=UPI0035F110B3
MEGLEPITQTDQASFCVEMLKRLNMQREHDYLCEITLVAKEGKEFKAHGNVLSAASPFFIKLLQTEMKEKEEGIVRFEEISEPILEKLLEFIYTGEVEIDDEQNAKDLIIAADYLLLVYLKTAARRFLEHRLTNDNCISTFHFAKKYQCEELENSSRKFIFDNFTDVAESDEFLNLDADEVSRWISSDEIYIEAEEDIFAIIQKWIEHKEGDRKAKFEELFTHLRLAYLSHDLLLDLMKNELVKVNSCCRDKVLAAILSSDDDEDTQSPRKRVGTHAIVVRGGKYTFCYLPEKDIWKRLADGQTSNITKSTNTIVFRDQWYIGSRSYGAERYDPVFDSWSSLNDFRVLGGEVVVKGQMYRIASSGNQVTVAKYNVGVQTWQNVHSSQMEWRHEACVLSANNSIFVIGGKKECYDRDAVSKVEKFDTVHKKWEEVADLQKARCNAFGVALHGKIYVAGGGFSRSCEVYSISSNEWQVIVDLGFAFLRRMVCVNGILYVLGGHRIDSYDPTLNKWTKKTSIPVDSIPDEERRNLAYTGCVLKLSKTVLRKAPDQGPFKQFKRKQKTMIKDGAY